MDEIIDWIGTTDEQLLFEFISRDSSGDYDWTRSNGGFYLLHQMAASGKRKVAKFLVEKGSDVNAISKRPCGGTLCHKCLDLKRFNKDCRVELKYTPLHFAVLLGRDPVSEYLLGNGANINAPDQDGRTPLIIACLPPARMTTVKMLIRAGAKLNEYDKFDNSALTLAIQADNKELFDILLENGADVHASRSDFTPFHEAVIQGRVHMTEQLIDKVVSVNILSISGLTPLIAMLRNDNVSMDIIKVLIAKGAKLNATTPERWTVAHYAAARGPVELLKIIGQNEPKLLNQPSIDGSTPLHMALQGQKREAAEYLLDFGVEVNYMTEDGCCPMYEAIKNWIEDSGWEPIIGKLIDRGACFENQKIDELPRVPTQINRCKGLLDLFRISRALKSAERFREATKSILVHMFSMKSLNGRDSTGKSALHHAVEQKNELVVHYLLEANINVKFATACDKRTALHCAIQPDGLRMVRMILYYATEHLGPDDMKEFISLRTADGKTALQIAQKGNWIILPTF